MDKKILILLPIWKREKITRICLDNLRELKKDINLDVLCVVSEQWAKLAAFEYGFKYVEASNDNLGAKMNIGVKESLKYKYDYLMNMGSDDIITKELFKIYDPHFKKGSDFFGGTRVTFIDSISRDCKQFDYKVMIGAGRCIKRSLIENVGQMYDTDIECGFDANSMRKFKSCSMVEIQNPYETIIDIKSDVNIWNYEELPFTEKVSFEKAVKGLSTKQIDSILDL